MKSKPRSKAPANKRRLTDAYLRSLKPPNRTKMIWDTLQGGFGIQITPKGTKSFKVTYRHKGRLRWYTLDKYPSIGLADARVAAQTIRARAALGEDPQGDKTANREGETFKDVAEKYVERYAKLKNKSWKQADHLMTVYVLPKLGTRLIRDITQRDILRVFNKLTIDKNRPVIANQVVAAVSAVLRWAVEQQIIERNVALGIRRNRTKEDERYLSDEELALIWPEMEQLGLYRTMALRLILLTAQRPGEVCAMRWEDIDLSKGSWTQPGDPDQNWPGTKNGRTHEVPLSPQAMMILDEMEPQEEGPVFPNGRGGFIRIPVTIPLWKKLDITRFRPHHLRATAASGMDALGIHKEHISRVLNHTEGGVTAGYIRHDHFEQKRHALEAWAAHLTAVVEGREPPSSVVDIRDARSESA